MSNVEITPDQMQQIRAILGRFRYGGQIVYPNMKDTAGLIGWLEAFSEVLVRQTDASDAREKELDRLKADLRAAGRLFKLMQED